MGLNNVGMIDTFDHAFDCRGQNSKALVDECITKYNVELNIAQGFNTCLEHQEECSNFFQDAWKLLIDMQLAAKGQLNINNT
eukprot:9074493-Ditylum_brightwellii.AAC.1